MPEVLILIPMHPEVILWEFYRELMTLQLVWMDIFLKLSKITSEDGYIAFKVTSSDNYGKGLVSDYTASLYHTAASVFPEIVVTPGTHNTIFACRSKKRQ